MNKNIWGPKVWSFIHTVTINYPVKPETSDKEHVTTLLYAISDTLPCDTCKEHFKKIINKHPPDVKSRETLFNWGVNIHNLVNKRLKKRELSYKEVLNIYEKKYNMKINFNSKNIYNKKTNIVYNVLFILLILILIFLYFNK